MPEHKDKFRIGGFGENYDGIFRKKQKAKRPKKRKEMVKDESKNTQS